MSLKAIRIFALSLSLTATLWAGVEKFQFGGTGMQLQEKEGLPYVIAVAPEGPAALAGVQPGDLLIAVDGQPLEGLTLDNAVELLRGGKGNSFELTLLRSDEELRLNLTRVNLSFKMVRCSEVRERKGDRATMRDLREHLGERRGAHLNVDGVFLDDSELIPQDARWGYSVSYEEKPRGEGQKERVQKRSRSHLSSVDGRLWDADPSLRQTTPLLGQ